MSDPMIEDSVQRLFAQEVDKGLIERAEHGAFPARLWQLVCDNGFASLMAREADGGIEADWDTCFALLTALGQHQVPLPVAETCIATGLLSAARIALPQAEPAPIALIGEAQGQLLQRSGQNNLRLSGSVHSVQWARWASHLLIGLGQGELALVARDASGLQLTPGNEPSRMPVDTVRLADTPVLAVFANPWPDLRWPVWTLGAAARAAMMVGALEFALDQAVQYAQDRVQFGKPIGKNQAIQQQLAQLAGDFASARMAALVACRDLPSLHQAAAPSAEFSTAVAKIRAGEAANQGSGIAHQVHGAIGFTYEHALNFATRRLWTWRNDFGGASWWAERLGAAFIAGGAEGFWPGLTERQAPVPLPL
jgi:acyl-CoA dehydrogenase